jgi:hypothetical protein
MRPLSRQIQEEQIQAVKGSDRRHYASTDEGKGKDKKSANRGNHQGPGWVPGGRGSHSQPNRGGPFPPWAQAAHPTSRGDDSPAGGTGTDLEGKPGQVQLRPGRCSLSGRQVLRGPPWAAWLRGWRLLLATPVAAVLGVAMIVLKGPGPHSPALMPPLGQARIGGREWHGIWEVKPG